jgi:hypothetical protein
MAAEDRAALVDHVARVGREVAVAREELRRARACKEAEVL